MRFKCVVLCLCLFTCTLLAVASNAPSISQIGQFNPASFAPTGFGTVAISDSTIAVAAAGDGYSYGAIYVYVKPSGGWTTMNPTATLSSTACCSNGATLAISADGSTIVASVFSVGFGGGGAALVYVRPASGWQDAAHETVVLVGGPYPGRYLAITPDGKTIVTTDYFYRPGKSYLYIFDRPAGGWTTMRPTNSILLSSQATEIEAVAINSSGTVAVTNHADLTVHVYQRSASGIKQVATLSASDHSTSGAGLCCSLIIDKQTIVVEGFNSGDYTGKAYLFTMPSSGWADATETAQLSAPNLGNFSFFGWDVAISGKAVLIGGLYTSAAYLYLEPAGGWQTTSQPNVTLLSSDLYQVHFGDSVAILGKTILVGDPSAGANSSSTGDAFIYQVQ